MSNIINIAKDILESASDVQVEISMTGSEKANMAIRNIRKQAADLVTLKSVQERIVAGERKDIESVIEEAKVMLSDESLFDSAGKLAVLGMTAETIAKLCRGHLRKRALLALYENPREYWGQVMHNKIKEEAEAVH